MRTGLIRAITTVALTGAIGAGLATVPAHAAGSTPVWEPDPASVGTLSFYDASGHQITSGTSNVGQFAAYVVGSTPVRAGDKVALLYFANPDPAGPPNTWNRQLTGNPTAYPIASGPANIQTLSQTKPVYTAAADDLDLETYQSITIPSQTAGYKNVFQIRMRTADVNNQQTLSYDVADVQIDPVAHTWTQLYPTPVVSTPPDAPTGVTAVAHNASATVSWTAPVNTGSSAISSYLVRYSKDSGATWTTAPASASLTTSRSVTGLTNGSTYVFQVAAVSPDGQSAWSASSAAVKPVADASSLLIAASSLVNYGSAATVSAKLTDSVTHAASASTSIALYRRASSTASWVLVKSVLTGSTGAASTTVTMTANTQWQWRYAGNTTHAAVTSATASTSVRPVIHAYASPTSLRHGLTVKIYGYLSPLYTGARVYLQRYYSGAWHSTTSNTLIKKQTMPNGRVWTGYILTYKTSSVGSYLFRVYKPASTTLVSGASGTVTVKAT